MALILLSLDRTEFMTLSKLAEAGESAATATMASLWNGYAELECFICGGNIIDRPPFTMVLPDYDSDTKLIAASLCLDCRSLPSTLRWHRCLKILKFMARAKTKKNITFRFNKSYHQPHPR